MPSAPLLNAHIALALGRHELPGHIGEADHVDLGDLYRRHRSAGIERVGTDIRSARVTLDTTFGRTNTNARRRNVVCHELGHALGLEASDGDHFLPSGAALRASHHGPLQEPPWAAILSAVKRLG